MKKLIVANWKLNPTSKNEAERLLRAVLKGGPYNVDLVLAPPFVWLEAVGKIVKRARGVSLGAQDLFWEDSGAYTGEISGKMLRGLGATYVIIGHSERKIHLGETDEMINKKVRAAFKAGLKPILCVGERERPESHRSGVFQGPIGEIIESQLKVALRDVPKARINDLTVAYEPVWAIGTGIPDTPEDAMSAAIFIRRIVGKLFGSALGEKLRVIYGGSVNAKNAASFINEDGIDGALVGGASLDAAEFVKLLKSL